MPTLEHPGGRDPGIDHEHELYPVPLDFEDRSEVEPRDSTGAGLRLVASNVDGDDVAHYLLITPDPGVPDLCGGCRNEWPCEGRVGVEVVQIPQATDPEEQRIQAIALAAAREAMGLPPQ